MGFEKGNKLGQGRPPSRTKLVEKLMALGQIDKAIANNEEDLSSEDLKVRRDATKWTLEMSYGKAPQGVEISNDETKEFKVTIV